MYISIGQNCETVVDKSKDQQLSNKYFSKKYIFELFEIPIFLVSYHKGLGVVISTFVVLNNFLGNVLYFWRTFFKLSFPWKFHYRPTAVWKLHFVWMSPFSKGCVTLNFITTVKILNIEILSYNYYTLLSYDFKCIFMTVWFVSCRGRDNFLTRPSLRRLRSSSR